MPRIGFKFKFLGLLGVALLLAIGIGCSDQMGPTESNSGAMPQAAMQLPMEFGQYEPGHVFENPTFIVIDPNSKYSRDIAMAQSVTELMTPAGGTITNGRVTLAFPPFAVNEDVAITIVMDDNGLYIADMGPEGLAFNFPVTMTFDLRGTSAEDDADNTYLAWYNPATGQWEMIENLPPVDSNHIRGLLHHFSKYSGVGG